VDYIVKNTVGKLCEGKTPAEVSDLRILDPACGSGSFLLGAYKYLMDWHLEYYKAEHEKTGKIPTVLPDKGKRQRKLDPYLIFKGIGEDWYLTTAEKKRILTNNLYGVDIDANAVEVTKLSLLLKVLEGENSETLSRQLGLWHERALPDLGGNIKCGNSLIGSDFFESGQAALFDEPEMNRVNAFDWDKEFPEIFTKGGFDAVIGNPPYVRQEGLGEFKPYFQKNYKVYHGVADLYAYFIEKGIKLLKDNGHFSYIVANKWMRANYGKPLRQWLKNQHLEELIDFGDLQVFQGATTYPCILKVAKEISVKSFQAVKVDSLKFINLSDHVKILRYKVNQMKLDDMGWSLSNEAEQKLLEKLNQKGIPLEEFVKGKIYYGIKTGLNEAFVITAEKRKEMIKQDPKSAELIKPFLAGQDIKRYARLKADEYVLLIPKGWTNQRSNYVKNAWGWLEKNYKGITKHLEPYKEKAEKRFDKGEYWWELRACEYYDEFEKTKIIYPNILKKPEFAFDVDKNYTNQKCFIIPIDDKYLLGILNSKIDYFFFNSLE
jgi:hypothetical protein